MNYELTTIKDIFDKVPADKWPTLFNELKSAFVQADSVRALVESVGGEFQFLESITWLDDGNGDITYRVENENGEEIAVVKTKA